MAARLSPGDDSARASGAPLRFTRDDVELFAEASHDRNPLHLSSPFARKSPYAEPIVFGVLSALACLGRLRDRPGKRLARISLEFKAPLFVDIDYAVETHELSDDAATALVRDGGKVALIVTATFAPGDSRIGDEDATESSSPLEDAADDPDEDFVVGRVIAGRYSAQRRPLSALARRLGLHERGISASQIAALLWSSYFVGMKVPGRRALFWRVVLNFEPHAGGESAELTYEASILASDRRFGLLKLGAQLFDGRAVVARGELWSFVRADVSVARSGAVGSGMRPSRELEGKTALVLGASRGLGAAIAQALAFKGCAVLATYLRSADEAEFLKQSVAGAPGSVVLIQGDASDPTWCEQARHSIVGDRGRLDLLICNAFPSPLPLSLEPHTATRIGEYVTRGFTLVSTPMAAFLPMLGESAGWCVTISSAYVKSPPPDLPHYVSAKYAVEGLTKAAAVGHPTVSFLIARPPTLRTDMSNSPMQRQVALAPEQAAIRIVERLVGPSAAGSVEFIEDFAQG